MLSTRLNLECDQCGNPFPACGVCPAPVDGAIYTPRMLRDEAREEGWKRPRVLALGVLHDICPRCAKKAARKGGK
jgi:hypothetical protein